MTGRAIEPLDIAIKGREGYGAFVSGSRDKPRLESPRSMSARRWPRVCGPANRGAHQRHHPVVVRRPGRDPGDYVDSPMSAARSTTSTTRCSTAPCTSRPRTPRIPGGGRRRVEALIAAAGGRTLALFTSWRRWTRRSRPSASASTSDPHPARSAETGIDQGVRRTDETCLFATAGLFQGVDVPGRRCRWS